MVYKWEVATGSTLAASLLQKQVPQKEIQDREEKSNFWQCVFMLVSTALGGGVLTMSYMIRLSGIALGCGIALWAGCMALIGMDILMRATVQDQCGSFAKLLAFHTGPKSQPLLDAMIGIYGNGVMIAYFVFLGDFMPRLVSDFGGNLSRTMLLLLAAALVLPFMLQTKMGILAKMTPAAILALAYTAIVIISKAPELYEEHRGYGNEPELAVIDWNIFQSASICIFAYNCHLNVVPIACRLKEPSRKRIAGVCSAAVLIQSIFYILIAVSGYISFMQDTQQDLLQSFSSDDCFLMVSRLLLTMSILIGIPVNFHPTVQSTMDLIRYFRPENIKSPLLLHVSATPVAPTPWYFRSMIVIVCVGVQITLAIKFPDVASVISLLGATCGTIMMFVIPAIICHKKILSGEEDTWQARVSFALMVSVSLVSCVGLIVLYL